MIEIDMLDRTTGAAEKLLADFDKELLAAPTPCTEWTVSELLDHNYSVIPCRVRG